MVPVFSSLTNPTLTVIIINSKSKNDIIKQTYKLYDLYYIEKLPSG